MNVLLPGIPILLVVAFLLTRASAKSEPKPADKPATRHDPLREVLETIVFVVALVLMLKLFAVEAFVIPTGSMAETLYGYQKTVDCPDCGHQYAVNSSNEADPQDGIRRPVVRATCPNCRRTVPIPDGSLRNNSGDRVLVHKAMYSVDAGPTRGDVVVFKFPVDPQIAHTAQNYIKRLWGFGGETLAIRRGDLFASRGLFYPEAETDLSGQAPKYPRPDDPRRLWEGPDADRHSRVRPPFRSLGLDFTYHNADVALQAFDAARLAGFPTGNEGGFQPLRKTDAQALAMRRIVYDNEHQSQTLIKRGVPPRWRADGPGWAAAADHKTFTHTGGDLSFVRYRHRVSAPSTRLDGGQYVDDWVRSEGGYVDGLFPPSPVTNELGYNSGVENGGAGMSYPRYVGEHWVGDLMAEATAELTDPAAVVVLEVSRGLHRFQASFANGEVAISRVGPGGRELARKPTGWTSGKARLRFANFDSRLRVWVDGRAVAFGPEADYPPTDTEVAEPLVGAVAGGAFAVRPDGHTLQNDILAPASVGASGGVRVGELTVWMDTYFTPAAVRTYDNPDDPVDTFYVQPGHYFCLGDNSGQSSDGRKWGLVPDRLMLGKACVVFFPLDRIGFIR